MEKAYEDKRRRLLAKFELESEVFAKTLEQLLNSNLDCRHLTDSIAHMMEMALEGRVPESSVPPEV